MWNRNNAYIYGDPTGYESQKGWYDTPSGLSEKVTLDREVTKAIAGIGSCPTEWCMRAAAA